MTWQVIDVARRLPHDRDMTTPHDGFWASYAVGLLRDVQVGEDIVAYLQRIDATLEPHDGHFLVHGGAAELVEGDEVGDVVVIGFPTANGAADWYHSPAYQDIAPLRTTRSRSQVVLLPGVPSDHAATDVVAGLAHSRVEGRAGTHTP